MDAFFARNRLSAYLDGALGPAEAAEVEDALARDPGLRDEYEAMRRAVDLLRRAGPVAAPVDLHDRIMAAVRAEPARTGVLLWLRRPLSRVPVEALALAAAALLVVTAIQLKPTATLTATKSAAIEAPADDLPRVSEEFGKGILNDEEPTPPEELAKAPSPPQTVRTAPPARATKSKDAGSTRATGGVSKGEVYIPSWETSEGEADATVSDVAETPAQTAAATMSEGVTARSAWQYRVTLSDPAVLEQLAALAASSGGKLTDGDGRTLAPRELTVEDNYANVMLVLPLGQADAAHSLLRSLGATSTPTSAGGPLYPADSATFRVEVQYLP